MATGATTKGLFYTFPWQPLGNWKYLIFLATAVLACHASNNKGVPWKRNISLHLLIVSALRYALFQLWGTLTRLPAISRKYQIIKKGIAFEQIDHESNWENSIFVTIFLLTGFRAILPSELEENMESWNWKGTALTFLIHIGPVEWTYYWAHRALHHHYLYTRYHSHHHSSFVTQPITANNHPMLESVFYNILFGIAIGIPYILGYGSFANFYIYILFVDTMDAWGHCNFEFIPNWLFERIPPLKYIVYSPTFHSLHHTKVHTNFSLFMPLYDYIYRTVDPTSDELYYRIREGRKEQLDCVYLTHPIEFLSFLHLPFGFQTFAAQPYSQKWYIWATFPIVLPLMFLIWMFGKPFAIATHFVGNNVELQTWMVPCVKFQYKLGFEKSRIQRWIQDCIVAAQENGVKVFALGLLNKDELGEDFLRHKSISIPIVNGETLTAAIVIKKIEALKESEVFLGHAYTRVGQAIAKYLCKHGTKVLAMVPSQERFDELLKKINIDYQGNLMHATMYADGRNTKFWVVGEEIGAHDQIWAPPNTRFQTFTTFPLPHCRSDCIYDIVPSLELPNYAKTINICEDVMPRNVVRASYAAGMIHSQEGWKHNDLNDDISTYIIDKTWKATLKHGFSLPK